MRMLAGYENITMIWYMKYRRALFAMHGLAWIGVRATHVRALLAACANADRQSGSASTSFPIETLSVKFGFTATLSEA